MNSKADGMRYIPETMASNENAAGARGFRFSVIGLDHGHIYGMAKGLIDAGATIVSVYDDDPGKVRAFMEAYPDAKTASGKEEILSDSSLNMIASAIRPDLRAPLGIEAMEAGFDFFSDKPGMVTLKQLEEVRSACSRTGRKYFVYFSGRVHEESGMLAQRMIDDGLVGKIISIEILAPHRLSRESRPEWFFDPEKNGSILTDIGSHQFEQMLSYTHSRKGRILFRSEENHSNPDRQGFSDTGMAIVELDSGAKGYVRADWLTPDGLSAWGDGRVFIVGTKAAMEIRKNLDVAVPGKGSQIILVDSEGEHMIDPENTIGFPFFGDMIRDCIDRTENAMTEEHILESMRLALEAHIPI